MTQFVYTSKAANANVLGRQKGIYSGLYFFTTQLPLRLQLYSLVFESKRIVLHNKSFKLLRGWRKNPFLYS